MTNDPKTPLGLPATLSPDALDTITKLASILTRLRTPVTLPNASGGGSGQTPAAAPTPSNSQNTNGELSLREVPAATDHLKHKLQKARAQIKTLPDMDRTMAEQEEEMRQLEDKIRRQREQLNLLREKGLGFAGQGRDEDRMQE
ncbi:RNA polymerase II transcription mediator complex subunit 9-domain-containing protein [Pseudomassariella vexata]|uniref:Mediator of RNA polymerase II transcription subunit 9 n=1 Tax=Pseudomassariella vexata TaxID=1141098 RepID=A0A1Y2DHR7_9PEZI|nr:RNA polymerase II transcription mediator complex subunit 9-domain-containing protein [Pseudomassariella vexata]ORY58793.1 RNA polymerase II transcription mediator complex subunit 9-domain-containing protein [Pseudomassariella vexata]